MSTETDTGAAGRDERVDAALDQYRRHRRVRLVFWAVLVTGFVVLFYFGYGLAELSIDDIVTYWPGFREALSEFFPPGELFGVVPFVDLGRYWEFISGNNLILDFRSGDFILGAAFTTLAMGFVGTVLGAPLALLFGVLGSERVTPFPFNFLFRGTMSIIRSIPALVWALIFIPLGGLGPFTATLAIATDTIGNLGRLFTDELEEVEDGPIEAIRSTGGSGPQTIVFGMLSQVFTSFIAWTMYILEINVRIAVTMGLIGGGGIGEVLNIQRQTLQFTNMMATIIVIFFLVVSVELISQRTRSYLRGGGEDQPGFLSQLWSIARDAPRKFAESSFR